MGVFHVFWIVRIVPNCAKYHISLRILCLMTSFKGTLHIRSNYPEVFCKNGVLKNFEKFTRNHLHQSSFVGKWDSIYIRARYIFSNGFFLEKYFKRCVICIFYKEYWILLIVWKVSSYLSVFSPNAGKYRPDKTPYLDIFHAVVNRAKLIF